MFDEEIERGVLFYIVFHHEEYLLDENDFINPKHKKIIKAINELKAEKKEITILNIKSKIKCSNNNDVLIYLSDLGEYITGQSSNDLYNTLIEYSKKRKTFEILKSKMMEISDSENIDILNQKIIKDLNKLNQINEKEKTFTEQVIQTIDELEKNLTIKEDYKLYTGMIDLDEIICGLHNEELTIIGARPGVGKTTFALQIAQKIATNGIETAIISLEMSETQIIQKMLAKTANVNTYKMRLKNLDDKDKENIGRASMEISQLPIHLITNIRTIQQIESIARKMKNKSNLGLLIIDYIQLVKNTGKFNSREQEVADISRTLKLLSLELKIPIIGLCQLNRNASRTEPSLADLRESGAIEQDADNVIFLYTEQEDDSPAIEINIKVAKQRAGGIGKAKMKFLKQTSNFVNLVRR